MVANKPRPLRYFFKSLATSAQPPDVENPGCFTLAVHRAARYGTVAELEAQLAAGGNPNARDDNGHTLLHLATDIQKVKLLLDAGADPRLMHYGGYTPLHLSAILPDGKLLSFYLDHLPIEALLQKSYHRQDSILHLAIRHGGRDMDLIQKIIDIGIPVNSCDHYGYTPLQVACEHGRADIARLLVQNGADVNKLTDKASFLAFAVYARSAETVACLVDAGIDVDTVSCRSGRTSLGIATGVGVINKAIIQHLLGAGANPNHRCAEGKTALHELKFEAVVDLLPIFLRFGADVNAQDGFGRTPMHCLINEMQERRIGPVRSEEESNLITALQLFLKAGANPELKDKDGKRIYEYAYSYSMSQTADFLEGVSIKYAQKERHHGPRP